MKSFSRDKAALGIFGLLVLVMFAALMGYIFIVGNTLNKAASSIDEATGSLDGYTVILFDGIATETESTNITQKNITHAGLIAQQLRAKNNNTKTSSDETTASDTTSAAEEQSSTNSLTTLKRAYVDAEAAVIEIDLSNVAAYNQSYIVRAGSTTFGFFSIDEINGQASYCKKRVATYESLDIDVIVCITTSLDLLESYQGADVVISTQNESIADGGIETQATFFYDSSLQGQVSTILISPSKTITAKDV